MSTRIREPVFNWPPGSNSVPIQDYRSKDLVRKEIITNLHSVVDPDSSDPYVFGPPGSGSGSISQRYGSAFFYHQAKIVRKTMIPTVL
jgi:hypothetical protein